MTLKRTLFLETVIKILIGTHGRNNAIISPGICWNLKSQKAFIKQMVWTNQFMESFWKGLKLGP